MPSNQKTKIISSLIIVIAAVAGFILSQQLFKPTELNFQALKVYPQQKTFSGFQLTDQDQRILTIEDFADQWTLMFFGFTYCPDVCPTTLNQLQRVYKKLEDADLKQLPVIMLVSVDPERDTPQQLKSYIDFFNPKFKAVTGDKGSLLSLSKQLGVAYHIEEHEPGDTTYDVNHTAAMFLVSPEKQLYGIFQTPHEDETLFADMKLLMEQ